MQLYIYYFPKFNQIDFIYICRLILQVANLTKVTVAAKQPMLLVYNILLYMW